MGTVMMVFSGEYDLSQKLSVRADFDSLCNEPDVILDMSGVTYLDSTFVSELLQFRALRLDRNLEPPSIVRNSSTVKRIFTLLALAELFPLVDTLDELSDKNGEPIAIRYALSEYGTDPSASINSTESMTA